MTLSIHILLVFTLVICINSNYVLPFCAKDELGSPLSSLYSLLFPTSSLHFSIWQTKDQTEIYSCSNQLLSKLKAGSGRTGWAGKLVMDGSNNPIKLPISRSPKNHASRWEPANRRLARFFGKKEKKSSDFFAKELTPYLYSSPTAISSNVKLTPKTLPSIYLDYHLLCCGQRQQTLRSMDGMSDLIFRKLGRIGVQLMHVQNGESEKKSEDARKRRQEKVKCYQVL